MSVKSKYLTVLDLFCGAGGFSEGFRQQGFKIIQGVDHWRPAIDTFNHNFGLGCEVKNVLDFSEDVASISTLPDTDIIIGSPPCVSFSSSNKCGNADKKLGVNLIEIFLIIIAVKKHQPNSKLKAWFMENVANSEKHLQDKYTFKCLGLTQWAKKHRINPNEVAINFKDNRRILNASHFGVAQARKRLFAGEVIKTKLFPELKTANKERLVSTKEIFRYFPHPFANQKKITDPNYKNIKLDKEKLTNHFYDTGLYESQWKSAQYHKSNHPYMGKMFFPEKLDNPSRTVTASKLEGSRESLIYNCELKRIGDGQYRLPTIREISTLMSFPITYQFAGSENTKWCLVGNAVAPLVSGAIAKAILQVLGMSVQDQPLVEKKPNLDGINNLNDFEEKTFDNQPIRKKGCRFRRHPFKMGNMTVALSNYCLKENKASDGKWRTTITYGQGKGYKLQEINGRQQVKIKRCIEENFSDGVDFIQEVESTFLGKIAKGRELQDMYEKNYSNEKLHPVELIEKTTGLVGKYANGEIISTKDIFQYKSDVHKRQLYALYVINQISQIANDRGSK